jgi:hypothetical protein
MRRDMPEVMFGARMLMMTGSAALRPDIWDVQGHQLANQSTLPRCEGQRAAVAWLTHFKAPAGTCSLQRNLLIVQYAYGNSQDERLSDLAMHMDAKDFLFQPHQYELVPACTCSKPRADFNAQSGGWID